MTMALLGRLLFCMSLLAGPVFSLDPEKHVTQYMHTSWGIQDGSAPTGLLQIAQTTDGYLWFASDSQGLYRFDGVRFLPWTLSATSKAINTIVNVYGDHAGGLWVMGEREILHVKAGVITSHFDLDGLQQFRQISEDADGSLWIVRGANAASEKPLCHITENAIKCFGKNDGVPISQVDSLLSDGKGGFWLGGQTMLVHWHDGGSEKYPIEALKSNAGQEGITSLALGTDGTLWVGILAEGRGLGLARLKDKTVTPFVTRNFDGSKFAISTMIFDRDGNLWLGTLGQGIFRIQGEVVDHYQRTEGLSGDTVIDLLEDREGLIWAVTTNGIDSFRDPAIATFSSREGLGADAVAGVLASKDGTIWIANAGSLDHIENGRVSSIGVENGLPGHQVTSLLEDRAGKLWVGVDDALYLFEQGRFRPLLRQKERPLGMVVALTEDIDENVWAECAGNPRRLVRFQDYQVREEVLTSQVPAGHSLAADPNGGIWIGTRQGNIVHFRNGGIETEFPLNPGGSPFNREIISLKDGSVLAGSENGLVYWSGAGPRRLTKKNGLPCDSVTAFIEDQANRWWLHTGCGVVQFADSELQRWRNDPETVIQTRVYDVLDGARSAGGPSFNPAAYAPDGRVWFATGFVVEMIAPSALVKKALPARTDIESLTVDRKEFLPSSNLKLAPHPRDLQITYTSPTLLVPQKVKFRYRLDGYENDWHDAGTRRQAFYTDLPAGNYSFRVLASNSDGVWSKDPSQLSFSVAPAYYETNWFRALCVAVLFALLLAAYQLRVLQLHRQFEMTLDARVGERTRIARELHDTLLQSFHGILLHLKTLSNELSGGQMKQKLDKVINQAAQAIVEGREAVQGLRASTVQGNDLALAIRTLGEELSAARSDPHPPHFTVQVEGMPRNLHPIIRDEVYRIAGEGLRNAFRHADAQRIEGEIRYDYRELRVRVRDNGKGIDSQQLTENDREGHFGLPGMRERAKLISGKLTVWSQLDAGTEVELTVPAAIAYTAATDGQKVSLREKFIAKLSGRATVKKT
jgi:signal transduction histidine kinase/ligand-binding sensor domain-containing protein